MTKADLADAVYERVGFSKKDSADLVDAIFETMKETLASGENLKISGFGNFMVRAKDARPGRNPQTGVPIVISGRRVVTFRPSTVLKDTLNDE